MTYFNTTDIQGVQLNLYEQKAKSQNDLILEFLRGNKLTAFTPFQIHSCLFKDDTPITSIRRSISVLYKQGWVIKTSETVIEKYNRPNYLYRFNQNKTL